MIRELINFVNDLERDYPEVFDLNKTPSPGLHLWVELDGEGNWKNNPPIEGEDYVIYDGKENLNPKLQEAIQYEELGKRVGNTMNKVLDKKKQIFSCSPFVVNFKLKSYSNDKIEGVKEDKIIRLLKFYFDNAISICVAKDAEKLKEMALAFKKRIPDVLGAINNITTTVSEKDGTSTEKNLIETFKDDFYINIYLKNVSLEEYKICHENYMREKLFNDNKYNSSKNIDDETFGLSNFINGANSKKMFLEHKTASLHKGISGRITARDALALNNFEQLLNNRVLPNPLSIFIDKKEFKNNSEIVSIFNNEGERKFSYPQLLKSIYEKDEQRVLGNYYLLNIARGVVNDFDFVSNFQYKLTDFSIENLFQIKQKGEILPSRKLRTIFGFENLVVTKIFNNGLVREKQGQFSYNYFNDIDPNYVSGGDEIANLILRFRKAFYDYIYKSRKQAITSTMFDEIMWVSILSDIKHDEFKDGYHTKETSIKEKLNIWFSLKIHFNNNKNDITMVNQTVELYNKLRSIIKDDGQHISTDEELAFASGQVIYKLLLQSESSNKTHAMLEPFLQKKEFGLFKNAICKTYDTYKHAFKIYPVKYGFDKIMSEVLGGTDIEMNMSDFMTLVVAGFFSPSIFKNENNNE